MTAFSITTYSIMALNTVKMCVVVLGVLHAECHEYVHYAECHYAECCYADSCHAECQQNDLQHNDIQHN
jgi:hypothetical protein